MSLRLNVCRAVDRLLQLWFELAERVARQRSTILRNSGIAQQHSDHFAYVFPLQAAAQAVNTDSRGGSGIAPDRVLHACEQIADSKTLGCSRISHLRIHQPL